MNSKKNLKESKKHFKNAKTIECLFKETCHKVPENLYPTVMGYGDAWLRISEILCIKIYDHKTKEFAKIVEYKEDFQEIRYEKKRLKKHGSLILEYLDNPSLSIDLKMNNSWKTLKKGEVSFLYCLDYRKTPQQVKSKTIVFENEIEEEFSQEDIDNDIQNKTRILLRRQFHNLYFKN